MFHGLGGAEAANAGGPGSGVYIGATADTIVATPFDAAPGTYSYCINPVNAFGDQYGFSTLLPDNPAFLIVPFMYRFTEDPDPFDASISIAELGGATGFDLIARRIAQNTSEQLVLVDESDGQIASTAGGYVAADTDYWMLWYVDLRVEAHSRDILWVWKAGAWDKAIDVSNHGNGDPAEIDFITFGTRVGKTAPTAGGVFYVDEMAVQVLNISPNTDPIGSVTTVVKVPKANGADSDFNTGTGTNPDWNDVKEIPPDDATSYDEGDVAGDQQSYEPNDAGGGDTPLAIQIIGQASEIAASATVRSYILENTTYDYSEAWPMPRAYRILAEPTSTQPKTWNSINSQPITEALFNTIEVGLEIVTLAGGASVRLSQIMAEYIVTGPKALPGDFPALVPMGGDRRRGAGFV